MENRRTCFFILALLCAVLTLMLMGSLGVITDYNGYKLDEDDPNFKDLDTLPVGPRTSLRIDARNVTDTKLTRLQSSHLSSDLKDEDVLTTVRATNPPEQAELSVVGAMASPSSNYLVISHKDPASRIPTSTRYTRLDRHEDALSPVAANLLEVCPWETLQPEVLVDVSTDRWRVVEPDVSFVFSAYWDPRYVKHVVLRLFGLLTKERVAEYEEKPYYCRLWLMDSGERRDLLVVPAVVELTIGIRSQRLCDVTYHCPFPSSKLSGRNIQYVTLTRRPCDSPTFAMAVHHPVQDARGYDREFTVCLGGPLRNNFSNSHSFVQWMEMNSLLGAEKFYIYRHSSHAKLEPYLDYYVRKGTAEMLDWRFSSGLSDLDWLRIAGQVTLINECMMRNMFRSKYVVYLDLDETIVPRLETAHNWKELLEQTECYGKSYVSARNVFFINGRPKGIQTPHYIDTARKLHLLFLLRLKRLKDFDVFTCRSKYMIRPEKIDRLKVHHVFPVFKHARETCVLEPDSGALQHYRWDTRSDLLRASSVADTTLMRFGDELTSRVTRVHNNVNVSLIS